MNKVGYNKLLGGIFLPISLFILIAGLQFGSLSAITGIILLIASIGYLASPALTYDEDQIELKNMLGMTVKRYHFGADEITAPDGKIYVNGRKLKVQRSMTVGREYDLLVDFIRNRDSDKTASTNRKVKQKPIEKSSSDDDYLEVF